MDAAAREAARGGQEIAAAMKRAAKLTESVRTPLERLQANIKEYKRLATDPAIPEAYRITQQTLERLTKSELDRYRQTSAAHQAWQALQAEAKGIIEGQRTAEENLIRTEQRLIGMMKLKLLTQQQVNAEMAKARAATPQGRADTAAVQRIQAAQVQPYQVRDTAIADAVRLAASGKISLKEMNAEIDRARQEYHEASAAGKEFIAMEERMKSALAATETALERHQRELLDYDAALKRDIIDQKEFNRLVAASKATYAASTQNIQRATSSLAAFGSTLLRQATGFVTVYAAYAGARKIVTVANDYALLDNRLRLVTKSGAELKRVQDELFGVAQRTRSEYAGVVELFTKLSLTQKDLGASQKDVIKFTEAVGNALTISGTTAQTARGALTQLAQGLASGVFRAEEFNAVLEGSPEIIRIVAKNIERFHGSVGALRLAVQASTLGSKEFFQAFLKGSDELKARVAALPLTISQAFQQLQNAFGRAVSQGGNVQPLVDSIRNLQKTLEDPAVQRGIATLTGLIVELGAGLGRAAAQFGTEAGQIVDAVKYIGRLASDAKDGAKNVNDFIASLGLLPAAFSGALGPLGILVDLLGLFNERLGKAVDTATNAAKRSAFTFLTGGPAAIAFRGITAYLAQLEEAKRVADHVAQVIAQGPGPRNPRGYPKPADVQDPATNVKKVQEAQKKIQELLTSLKQQGEVMGDTQEATMRYRIEFGDLVDDFKAAGPAFAKYRDELIKTARQLDQFKAGDELKKANEALAQQVVEITASRIEATQGALAADRYRRSVGELGKTVQTANGELDAYGKALDAPKDATSGLQQTARGFEQVTASVGGTTSKLDELKKQLEDLRKNARDSAGFKIDLTRPRVPVPGTDDVMTEKSITEEIYGRWYNLPTVVKGALVDVETAIKDAKRRIAAGEILPNFATLAEAEKQAPLRSEMIGSWIEADQAIQRQITSLEESSKATETLTLNWSKSKDAVVSWGAASEQAVAKVSGDVANMRDNVKKILSERDELIINVTIAGLPQALEDLQKQLLEATGDTLGAARLEIEQEFRAQKANLQLILDQGEALKIPTELHLDAEQTRAYIAKAQADARVALSQIAKIEQAKLNQAQIEPINQNIEDINTRSSREEQRLQTRIEAGLISEIRARKELIKIHQQQAAALQVEADKLRAIPDKTREQIRNLEELDETIKNLKETTDEFRKVFADAFETNTASALYDLASGVKSLQDAATDFLRGISEEILHWATQEIAAALRDSIFGGVKDGLAELFKGSGGGLAGIKDFFKDPFGIGKAAVTAAGGASGVNIAGQRVSGPLGSAAGGGGVLAPIEVSAQRLPEAVDTAGLTTAATALATATTAMTPAATALSAAMTTAASALQAAALALQQAATAASSAGGATGAGGGLAALLGGGGGTAGATLEPIVISAKYIAKGGPVWMAPSKPIIVRPPTRLADGGLPPRPPHGLIRGPGTGTSDSIPALVSNHEYFMPAKIVERPGVFDLLESLRRGQIQSLEQFKKGAPRRFADGGLATVNARPTGVWFSGWEPPANPAGGKNVTQHNQFNFHFEQPQSRQTQLQLAAATARGLRRADQRNN